MKRLMSEHGRAIWKAWADGKEVQYKVLQGKWEDAEPISIASEEQPQNYPSVWRIKPERKLISKLISLEWRVALMRDEDDFNNFWPMCVLPHNYDQVESSKKFVKWATDVISSDYFVDVFVDVEE